MVLDGIALMKSLRKIIDILMIVLLPMLMAYSLIGEENHELIGICMFCLFAAHHYLNRKWWTAIFCGRYTSSRVFGTCINILLAIYMLMQPVSGVLMSKHVLVGVAIDGAAADLRVIHMSFAYWGFILLSVHIGLHTSAIMGRLKTTISVNAYKVSRAIIVAVSAYGMFAFIRQGIADYLLFKVQFAFIDESASKLLFMLDYFATMVLVASLTNIISKGVRKYV